MLDVRVMSIERKWGLRNAVGELYKQDLYVVFLQTVGGFEVEMSSVLMFLYRSLIDVCCGSVVLTDCSRFGVRFEHDDRSKLPFDHRGKMR